MIGVVIVVGLVLAYTLGRSDGAEKAKKKVREFLSDDKGRK